MNIRFLKIAHTLFLLGACYSFLFTQVDDIYITGDLPLTSVNTDKLSEFINQRSGNSKKTQLVLMGNYHVDKNVNVDEEINELSQLDKIVDKFYIISSDYRWRQASIPKLKKIEEKIQDKLDSDVILPDNSCGEIETKDITDDIVMMVIDSEWYLQDWSEKSEINAECEIRSRELFLKKLAKEVYDYREKTILFFVHHPPRRYDAKGGFLNAKNALLPIPIVSGFVNHTNQYAKAYQSGVSPRYRGLSDALQQLAEDHGRMFVISEDANYSMIENSKGATYMTVSTSNKKSHYAAPKENVFSTKSPSIFKLSIVEDKISIELFAWDNITMSKPQYSTLKSAKAYYDKDFNYDPNLKTTEDSILTPIFSTGQFDIGMDWLTGTLNTDLYHQPVKVKVLDFGDGKLEPEELGGGQQTVSVKFEDPNGNTFTARPLQKNPTKLLPDFLRFDFTKDILSYFFTSANPYAFMTTHVMERELGLFHTQPDLRYMPYHKDLGIYNEQAANKLVQYSNRGRGIHESLDPSDDLEDSDDVETEYLEGKATFASGMYQRVRLLDMLINDWDRHTGQWKWIPQGKDNIGRTIYAPIARDRDQAYSNLDGFLLNLIRSYSPNIFGLQPFDESFDKKSIKWKYKYAGPMDQRILNGVTKEEWDKETAYFQSHLTPKVIEQAMSQLPTELNQKEVSRVAHILTSRLSKVADASEAYYGLINEKPILNATYGDDDIFIVEGENSVEVRIYNEDSGEHYSKNFDSKYTSEITVMGVEGDDEFFVDSSTKSGIKIRLIGGYGSDTYKITPGANPHIHIIEDKYKNIPSNASKHITNNKIIHVTDREDFMQPYNFLLPMLEFNNNEGLFIGGTMNWFDPGFKSMDQHQVNFSFATKSESIQMGYRFERRNDIKRKTFFADVDYYGPKYVFNFFGQGNDSEFDKDKGEEYYFTTEKRLNISSGWIKEINPISNVSYGVSFDRRRVIDNIRFINNETPVLSSDLETQLYAGAQIGYELRNFDSSIRPCNGLGFKIGIDSKTNVNDSKFSHISAQLNYEIYKTLIPEERLIYSLNLQGEHIIGDYRFYDAASIGGDSGVRGLVNNRYSGRSALALNNNLHIKLVDKVSKKALPAALGLTLSYDVGRVWFDEENDGTLHTSYGVGLWLSPFETFNFSLAKFYAQEDQQIRFKIGWMF